MPKLHLVVGPVGAGKSTYARKLCDAHGAVMLNLDAWMAVLYGDDVRPPGDARFAWYIERTSRCTAQIWEVAEQLLARGVNAVLEIGLVQREPRLAFLGRLDAAAYDYAMHVVDAPREVRRERVVQRNTARGDTFAMVVPPEIFELASDMWQPPDDAECRDREVHRVTTG